MPDALVIHAARDLRIEVRERIAGDGTIIEPLDLQQLAQIAGDLASRGIEAVAISFLNAYLNSAHEDEAAAFLRKALPQAYIVAGSELTREWFEYERTSTAAANAYAGPRLADCITRLDARMRGEGLPPVQDVPHFLAGQLRVKARWEGGYLTGIYELEGHGLLKSR